MSFDEDFAGLSGKDLAEALGWASPHGIEMGPLPSIAVLAGEGVAGED